MEIKEDYGITGFPAEENSKVNESLLVTVGQIMKTEKKALDLAIK